MEEAKGFLLLAANLGGFGVMSFVLWALHRESIRLFIAQLNEEREASSEQMKSERLANAQYVLAERAERTSDRNADRQERREHHSEVVTRLDRIEIEVRDVKNLLK